VKILVSIAIMFASLISSAQTINVGITGSNPPFTLTDDQTHHYSGFDIDIMNEVSKRMNVNFNYVQMKFKDFFPAIENGRVNLAVDSIIITPDRKKKYLFSMPYLVSKVQFLTNKSSPINTPSDIVNKRIGVRQSTQFKGLFSKLYNNNVHISVYDQISDVFNALSENKVDAIIINSDAAQYWLSNNDNQYKPLGLPIPLGMGFGVIAKQGQNDLIKRVNKALQGMESDGSYLKIYSTYFN